MISDEVDEVIKELFGSFKNRDHNNLELMMKSSEFVFDHVQLLYYKCHKRNLYQGELHIDSPDLIKKATINAIKKEDNKCFQLAVTVALDCKGIKSKE